MSWGVFTLHYTTSHYLGWEQRLWKLFKNKWPPWIWDHSTLLKKYLWTSLPASVPLKHGWVMKCWLQTETVNIAWKKRVFVFFGEDVLRLPDFSREEKVRWGEMASQILSAVFTDKKEVQSLGSKRFTYLCYLWFSQSLSNYVGKSSIK